jgi:hypothetical protein
MKLATGSTNRFSVLLLTFFLAVGLYGIFFSAWGLQPAYAANIVVDDDCSLSDAIMAAKTNTAVNDCPAGSSETTITIEAGPIILASALPTLSSNIHIVGNGHTVSGDNSVRIFDISGSGVITITNLIVADGNPNNGFGGGIRVNNGGQLWLIDSVVRDSQAPAGGGLRSVGSNSRVTIDNSTFTNNSTPNEGGGGINNDNGSVMTITNSLISNNEGLYAGGIANYNGATLTIINSTISGNHCTDPGSGGGVENFGGGSTLIIRHSTITDNSCGGSNSGGGIFNNTTPPILSHTIVAGNSADRPDLSGNFNSEGHNLIGNSTGGTGFSDGVNGDQVGDSTSPIDPLLGPLANNGGDTQTHALLPASPAIDAGDNDNAPATDQRGPGFPRILNGTIDIGAYEACFASLSVTNTLDDGFGSLRERIRSACNGGVIGFEAALANETIGLTSGHLLLDKTLTITNSQAAGLTISGNNSSRVFDIGSSGVITMTNLIIAAGNAGSGFGGGIRVNNGGQLWLTDSVVRDNQAHAGGGVRSVGSNSRVIIHNSTFTNNSTPNEGGGGINNDSGSVMTITDSTISNNNGRFAGGIANYNGGNLTIINSTISGNQCNAAGSGGGVENYDGGSLLTIRHSTITNNSCSGSNSGGGIFNNTTPPVLSHTIVANNSADRPDLSGSFSSGGYNLIGNRTGSSGFSDGVNNDLVGDNDNPIDPLLEPLANNGGETQTHALLFGSLAVNAGDPSTDWGVGGACPAQDQRGYGRNGRCDIGAFEFEGNPTAVTLTTLYGQSGTIGLPILPLIGSLLLLSGLALVYRTRRFNHPTRQP